MSLDGKYDEELSKMLLAHTSNALGGDLRFVDTIFSFLRRKTNLLNTNDAVNRVQDVALRHFNIAKKERADKEKIEKEKADKAKASKDNNIDKEKEQKEKQKEKEKEKEKEKPAEGEGAKKNEDEEEKNIHGPPPPGNGGSTDKYVWTQSLKETIVQIKFPLTVTAKQLVVKIQPQHLLIKLHKQTPLVDGELFEKINIDTATWTLENEKEHAMLSVYLTKIDKSCGWWPHVVTTDPKINTQAIVPETSQLHELEPETRATVEKMMFDQRQKQLGLPTSDDAKKRELLKKFMDKHPEMDFSKANIS